MLKFEFEPLHIEVVEDTAIGYMSYEEAWTTSAGEEEHHSGRWAATFVKHNGEWKFLNWSWSVVK
jgi:ketosteroid isomerase-like protein